MFPKLFHLGHDETSDHLKIAGAELIHRLDVVSLL